MPHYFFDLARRGQFMRDEIGDLLVDDAEAEDVASASSREQMQHATGKWRGAAFVVRDEQDRHIATVLFKSQSRRPVPLHVRA